MATLDYSPSLFGQSLNEPQRLLEHPRSRFSSHLFLLLLFFEAITKRFPPGLHVFGYKHSVLHIQSDVTHSVFNFLIAQLISSHPLVDHEHMIGNLLLIEGFTESTARGGDVRDESKASAISTQALFRQGIRLYPSSV